MSVGLFFENWVHYNSIHPPLSYHIRKNKDEIIELAECLFDQSVASFWDGLGRSGKAALRGKRNFSEGLGRQSYFAGSGFDPRPEKDDVYTPVSGSGRKDLADKAVIAKKYGMKVATITRNPKGHVAKEADIIITMPSSIAGEYYIKNYFERLISNQPEENQPKEKIPFQALGAVFEMSVMEFIDGFSYAFTKYDVKKEFPFHMIEEKLYNSLVYMGDLGDALEQQNQKVYRLINTILESKGDVLVTGFRYNAEIADIGAIRIHHEIYERGKRKARVIDSREFPEIKKGDILIAISGEGESIFTNYVARMFLVMGNSVFSLTSSPNSKLVEYVGVENSIIFPLGKYYELEKYAIGDFEMGVVKALDAIALSLGRSEADMRNSHSIFS